MYSVTSPRIPVFPRVVESWHWKGAHNRLLWRHAFRARNWQRHSRRSRTPSTKPPEPGLGCLGKPLHPDVDYVEHAMGTMKGRDEVRTWITRTMTSFPGSHMTDFPALWAVFDDETGRVICELDNPMRDPGDGTIISATNISIITYAGDGLWSRQEDIYNPARFGDAALDGAKGAGTRHTRRRGRRLALTTSEDARDEARRRGQRIPWLTRHPPARRRWSRRPGHGPRVPTRRASTISTSRDSSATSGTTTSFGGRCPDVTTCITA